MGMIGSHPTHRTLTSGLPRVSWGTQSPALERREISVDCMSYKDGDAKHT